MTFSSIKALNMPTLDKDSWSFKGAVMGGDFLEILLEEGTIDMELLDKDLFYLDTVTFDIDECRKIRKGTGLSCRTEGARFTVTEVRAWFPALCLSVLFVFRFTLHLSRAHHSSRPFPDYPPIGQGQERRLDVREDLRLRPSPRVRFGYPGPALERLSL